MGDDDGEDGSYLEEAMDVFEVDWVAVFAFFDETGTHGESARISAVAGYLFDKNGAKRFRELFNGNIRDLLPLKNGKPYYHSTKCILGYDPFHRMTVPQREHIVDLMVDAIKQSVTLGVVIAIPKEAHEEAIKAAPGIDVLSGGKYSQCVVRCIEYMAGWLDHKKLPGRIQYVFESGCNEQGEANAILGNIATSDELKKRYRWHNYSFNDKDYRTPQLFASDLLAWEWQRAYINGMNPKRGEWRLTLSKLFNGTPHIPRHLGVESVGIRAIVNAFHGVITAEQLKNGLDKQAKKKRKTHKNRNVP